jgi:hypothetical protein
MKFLGRSEKILLPELEILIPAKIDTGAFSNSIHVDNIELKDNILTFQIANKTFTFTKYKMLEVKNSFGQKQKRFLIFTKIKIGESTYKVYLSLTNRKTMKYPMLLGRRFLYKFGYVVDVTKKNIYDRDKKV